MNLIVFKGYLNVVSNRNDKQAVRLCTTVLLLFFCWKVFEYNIVLEKEESGLMLSKADALLSWW